MPWGAAIAAGAAVVGSSMQADAASSAADAQVGASREATQAQREMFDISRQDLSPYRDVGSAAASTLAQRLGLGGYYVPATSQPMGAYGNTATQSNQTSSQSTTSEPFDIYSYGRKPYPSNGTDQEKQLWQAAHNSLIGRPLSIDQRKLLDDMQKSNTSMQNTSSQDTTSQNNAMSFVPGGGSAPQTIGGEFTNEDFMKYLAPNYQFQLQQGQLALQNSQAAQNGVMSGAALKGMQDYVQGTASGAYQNAFNNWMGTQNMNYNQLYNLATLGQNAASMSGNQAIQTGANIGQNIIGAGNAQAAGKIAGGRAIGGTLSNIGNYGMAGGFGDLGTNSGDFTDLIMNGSF